MQDIFSVVKVMHVGDTLHKVYSHESGNKRTPTSNVGRNIPTSHCILSTNTILHLQNAVIADSFWPALSLRSKHFTENAALPVVRQHFPSSRQKTAHINVLILTNLAGWQVVARIARPSPMKKLFQREQLPPRGN